MTPLIQHQSRGQEQCAEISTVAYESSSLAPDQPFTCNVMVNPNDTGNPNIVCGVSINGAYPENWCPSDTNFNGWQDNHALFTCSVPAQSLPSEPYSLQLVSFDNRDTCKDSTYKTSMAFDFSSPPPPQSPSQPGAPSDHSQPDYPGAPLPDNPGNPDIPNVSPTEPPPPAPTSSQALPPNDLPLPQPPVAKNFLELDQIFADIEEKIHVPRKLMKAIVYIENRPTFGFTAEQIQNWSQPGATIPEKYCSINSCSAVGPAQMSVGKDADGNARCPRCCEGTTCSLTACPNEWATYSHAVSSKGGYERDPLWCNLLDNIYSAALKLKTDSGVEGDRLQWTDNEIIRAGGRYYGDSDVLYNFGMGPGKMTYRQFVLWYMKHAE